MLDVTRVPNITVAVMPPPCPLVGDEWWNTVNGQLYIFYDDGNTRQWVVANRSGPGDVLPVPVSADGVVTPEMFKAKGNGAFGVGGPNTGTDDTAAFKAALTYLENLGYGTFVCGPRHYMIDLPGLDQLFFNLTNIKFQCVPGQTIFDFTRTDGYYNGSAGSDGRVRPNGFIRTAGTKHDGVTTDAPIMLTNDTIVSTGIVGMIVSATRVAEVITAVMDADHDLVVGNLIWVKGDPGITGESILDIDGTVIGNSQQCFFTVRSRTLGPTIPVLVASTPTPTSFTYVYAGDLTGQDTVLDIRTNPYVVHASDVMSVPNSALFSQYERVMIGSLAERGRDNEHCNIGEYQEISAILTSTLVRFYSNVRDTYSVADGARVYKLSQISNLTFDGLTILGKGANLGVGRGDVAISTTQTHNFTARNCIFRGCDLMSLFIFHTSKAVVEGCTFIQDQRDQAGRLSGVIDIEYDVNYGGCVEDITIQNNKALGGRHFAVQGGSSSDNEFGVARVIRILNNYCAGFWLDPISTHQSADLIIIIGNTLLGNHGGINPRYAKNLIVANNLVVSEFNALLFYNDVLNALVVGNVLDAGHYPLQIKSIDNATANVMPDGGAGNATKLSRPTPAGPPIQIISNQMRNGRNGFQCVDTTPGLVLNGLEFTSNSISNTREEAVRILIGNPTAGDLAIASGSYDNATGFGTLVLSTSDTRITAGVPFTLSGLTGTGNFAALNGNQKAISPTSTIDTITFAATPGLGAITITPGGLILLPSGESYAVLSGTYVSATGVSTVRVPAQLPNLLIGDSFTLSGLQGTGSVSSLNGTHVASAATVVTTTVVFKDTPGNGATTITGGALTLPLGGFTGTVSNNNFYDCCLTGDTYQIRLANPMAVGINDNRMYGTSACTYAIFVAGDATTTCEFMRNYIAPTLYSTSPLYPLLPGSWHKTDLFKQEKATIANGIAALKFTTTSHLLCRMEAPVMTVASGAYDNATGAVTLSLTAPHTMGVGSTGGVAGLTASTGDPTPLNGSRTFTAPTSGSTVTYMAAPGLGAIVITGGAINATSDDLVAITGAEVDQELTLSTQATGWNITAKHGSGLELEGDTDKVFTHRLDLMKVIWSGQDNKMVQLTPLMNHG